MKTIFTKIINKEIPCYLIAESEFVIAFLDINPIARGHVLVVPKIQVDYLFDLDEETYYNLWSFVKKISSAIKKTISCKKVGVSVIGLEVPHVHVHLVPLNHVNDMDFSNKKNIDSEELKNIAKKISQAV